MPPHGRAQFGEPAAESGDGHALLFEAVVGALAVAASERRLVCVIEDVHWIVARRRGILAH